MITIQKTYELRCVVLNPTLLRSRYEYNLDHNDNVFNFH